MVRTVIPVDFKARAERRTCPFTESGRLAGQNEVNAAGLRGRLNNWPKVGATKVV